jgi:hypothetical protein
MNHLLEKLTGGSLISDGQANEVADSVLDEPDRMPLLLEGLQSKDNVVRARTVHALERISRNAPESLVDVLPDLLKMAVNDPVPMVRWHIPMILANIRIEAPAIDAVFTTLFKMLEDKSIFVVTWAIVSLVILSRNRAKWRVKTIDNLRQMETNPSKAVRTKVAKAREILANGRPLPQGWYKAKK